MTIFKIAFAHVAVRVAYFGGRWLQSFIKGPLLRLEQRSYEWLVADGNIDRVIGVFNQLYLRDGFAIVPRSEAEAMGARVVSEPKSTSPYEMPWNVEKN